MDGPEWPEVKELFRTVIEMEPEQRREALRGAAPEVRREVEALLEAHEQAERSERAAQSSVEGPGSQIGRYKLLQEIGAGGFGVVFMAEQREPVRRRVALKIIKRGMDTDQVVARFEAERQALALMDHPHIAKVFDGGATARGRPYFVMELVKGVPITEYCDRAALSPAERLGLFTQVCNAVQHAHQKGIIHRDLKPSNVLVTLHDGKPVPKVIDFGIAKATNRHLTEKTLFTEFRQMIGTPEYMAPEQAEMSGLDVDTRADVYSLGVMLYELLTGTKPFDLKSLFAAGYEEMLRTIREVDPPKPSTRVSTMGDDLAVVAQNRHTAPRMLGRLIRGDLDWIVMKALEKDRSRRYDTASALAADLDRHLTNQPVLAGRPGRLYRAGKYVRRHRVGVLATSIVLLALVSGLVAAMIGVSAARAAADREATQRARAGIGEQQARRGEAKATAALNLLLQVLGQTDPFVVPDPNFKVRDLLDRMSARLEVEALGEPTVEAAVRQVLGTSYGSLGLHAKAKPHLAAALDLRVSSLGEEHPDTVASRIRWAENLIARGHCREAVGHAEQALEILRRTQGDAVSSIVSCLECLSGGYRGLARFDEAGAVAREAVALGEANGGEDFPGMVTCLRGLALASGDGGDPRAAAATMDRALDLSRRLHGEDHPTTLCARIDAIGMHVDAVALDRVPAIEAELKEALAALRRVFGEDHPLVAHALGHLGRLYQSVMQFEQAEEACRDALAICRRAYGGRHERVLSALVRLGALLTHAGRFDLAEEVSAEALSLSRELGEESALEYVPTLLLRAQALSAGDRREEGLTLARAALAWCRTTNEAPPLAMADALLVLGVLHLEADELGEAERCLREGLAICRRSYGDTHPAQCDFLYGLARVEENRLESEAAVALLREALDIARSAQGESHPRTLFLMSELGRELVAAGRWREAEPILQGAIEAVERAFEGDHVLSAVAHTSLGVLRNAQGDAVASEPHIRKALSCLRAQPEGNRARISEALLELASVLSCQGRPEEAEAICDEGLALLRQVYGESHPHVAAGLLIGAKIQEQRGQMATAEQLTRRALKAVPNRTGQQGVYRARALEQLAQIHGGRREFAEGERLSWEAVEILTEISGPSSLAVASPLLTAAMLRMPQGNMAGAEDAARRALGIVETRMGERNLLATRAHGLLGHIALAQGREESAEHHLRRAVKLDEELRGNRDDMSSLYGRDLARILYEQGTRRYVERAFVPAIEHLSEAEGLLRRFLAALDLPEMQASVSAERTRAVACQALAQVLYRRGRCRWGLEDPEGADPDFREAAVFAREAWGPEVPWRLACELDLCTSHILMGRFEDAEELASECLPWARKVLPPVATNSYLDLATFLDDLGRSLLEQDRWKEAEVPLREGLTLREKHAGDTWDRYWVQTKLGAALAGQGRFAEAESLLLEGHEGLVSGKAHRRYIREAADWIAKLYEKWDNEEKAEEWRARAAKTADEDD